MTIVEEHLTLRLVEAERNRGRSVVRLNIQASIAVTEFRGENAFFVSVEALDRFLEQLAGIDEGRYDSAQIECGLLDGDIDVIYFRCHVEVAPPGFVGHVSLGTAGSNGLLHRLHVGLRIAPLSLTAFRRDLERLVVSRSGTAVLRGCDSAQPDKPLQPASRARKKAKTMNPRTRAARG